MKYQGLTFPIFALLAFTVVLLNSSSSGGNLTGACNSCHGSNTSANGSINLIGLPNSGTVAANTTYAMQVCIVDPSKLVAGYRVETDLGTFATTDAGSQTNAANDRITHTFPKSFGSPGNPACWDFDWTSPNTGPTEPSFTLRGNAANANSSPTGDNAGYIETSQGLPVEFASFEIVMNDVDVDIFWTTASEVNNDRFIIQRSVDNVRYTNIATVEGNENSTNFIAYHYQDKTPPNGTLYYRILQIDLDGTKDYSTTRVLTNKNIAKEWHVYPNPINLNTTITINIDNASTDLSLIDNTGRIVQTYQSDVDQGSIVIEDDLDAGIYYLTDGNQTVLISIIQ